MNVSLDRRIRIESRSSTLDDGAPVDAWTLFASVYAEMRDTPPSRSEGLRTGLVQARNLTRCRIRWLDGVTSAMRVVWQGTEYNIVGGPSELGRREFMEMVLERYASPGSV